MNPVESLGSLEAIISEHYCMRKMLGTIKEHCGAEGGWETSRILNRYIITSKSLGNDEHPAIPEFAHKESTIQFYHEIKEKYPNVDIDALSEALCEIRDIYLSKTHLDRGVLKKPKFEKHRGENGRMCEFMVIDYDFTPGFIPTKKGRYGKPGKPGKNLKKHHFDTRVPKHIYDHLFATCEDTQNAHEYIYAVSLRYNVITCSGKDPTQWCCSDDIFDVLSEELACGVELFASPISRNTRMDIYGSLFHDTDRHFGSIGTYVDLISEKRLSGFMQAHPPPIEMIINDFSQRALEAMDNKDRPLGFICMLPYWKDSHYFQKLIKSEYCRRIVLCSKYANSGEGEIEELAEPYFTFYSPFLNQDIPAQLDRDRTAIVILANDSLWNAEETQYIVSDYFPDV